MAPGPTGAAAVAIAFRAAIPPAPRTASGPTAMEIEESYAPQEPEAFLTNPSAIVEQNVFVLMDQYPRLPRLNSDVFPSNLSCKSKYVSCKDR